MMPESTIQQFSVLCGPRERKHSRISPGKREMISGTVHVAAMVGLVFWFVMSCSAALATIVVTRRKYTMAMVPKNGVY